MPFYSTSLTFRLQVPDVRSGFQETNTGIESQKFDTLSKHIPSEPDLKPSHGNSISSQFLPSKKGGTSHLPNLRHTRHLDVSLCRSGTRASRRLRHVRGAPGELRLCYANLPPAKCAQAAERLKAEGQFLPLRPEIGGGSESQG